MPDIKNPLTIVNAAPTDGFHTKYTRTGDANYQAIVEYIWENDEAMNVLVRLVSFTDGAKNVTLDFTGTPFENQAKRMRGGTMRWSRTTGNVASSTGVYDIGASQNTYVVSIGVVTNDAPISALTNYIITKL